MTTEETKEHLDNALLTSRFRLGDYLDEGYNLWKRKPLSYVAIILLLGIASSIANLIPVIGPLMYSLIVSPCIILGIYLGSKILDNDSDEFRFEDFFSGFAFLSKAIVLYLIIFGLAILLILPIMFQIGLSNIELINQNDPSTFPVEAFNSTTLLLILPLIYAALLTSYAVPILGIYNLEPWDALRYSAKFIHKHWIMFFLYMLVILFIVLLGLIALIIGVVVTASMIYPMIYVSFKDVTDLDSYLNQESDDEEPYTGATLDDFR